MLKLAEQADTGDLGIGIGVLLSIVVVSILLSIFLHFLAYKLVKYGIEHDTIWPFVPAFFFSGFLIILFWLFLKDRANNKEKKQKSKERKDKEEIDRIIDKKVEAKMKKKNF